jgi:hypothetical protein
MREKYVALVSLAEDDNMIEAFLNQAFSMSILPSRSWRGWSSANAHAAKSPSGDASSDSRRNAGGIEFTVGPWKCER